MAFRFTGTEVQAAGMWGVTGAVGAIWLVRLDLPCTTGPGVSARSARKAVLPGGRCGAARQARLQRACSDAKPGALRGVFVLLSREPAAYQYCACAVSGLLRGVFQTPSRARQT